MNYNPRNCNFLLLSVISTCLIISTNCQDFQSSCSATKPCSAEKYLTCLDGFCECEDSENQIYDPIEEECVIVAGKACPRARSGTPQCVQGADCNATTNTCQCLKGFYETDLNICSYTIGKRCQTNTDCDTSSGLVCQDTVCKCQNSSYIWQLDLGCVTANDIKAIGTGLNNNDITNVTFVPVVPSTNTEDESSVEPSSSEVNPAPEISNVTAGVPSSPINSNNIDGSVGEEDYNNTALLPDPEFPASGEIDLGQNGSDIGDRGVFQNVLQNNPILNFLNPNRRRPQNTLQQQPSFIPNEKNFAPEQLQQSSQNNQQGSQQQPQNINQQSSQQQYIPQNNNQGSQQQFQPQNNNQGSQQFNPQNNFQRPSNAVTNIFTPAPLPNANNIDNRRPFGFPIIRNILHPWKRFFFPRLADQEFRLPSPIWLTVSTINQILPVLRAIDHQISPWLQTVADITRPAYIPSRNQNNNGNQYQQSNNLNQFQSQQNGYNNLNNNNGFGPLNL